MRVLLNCATSLDGRLAGSQRVEFSGPEDWQRVHAMRAEADAVLVGVETILMDDPSLRVKPEYAEGNDPLRVVLDTTLRTPPGAKVVDGSAPTILFHAPEATSGFPAGLTDAVPRGPGGLDLHRVLQILEDGGVETLMVEGGAKVLASFLNEQLWDEWTLYQAPVILGHGPSLPPAELNVLEREPLGAGVLWTFGPTPAPTR